MATQQSKTRPQTRLSKLKTKGTSSRPLGPRPDPSRNSTDLVYQEVKLYIEGVQVPFESISISQTMGQMPSASIQLPPQAGLMDICRYYQPKVHIFFTDLSLGGDRLLFWGHITGASYGHSRAGSGSASVTLHCVHKNELMRQLTLDYTGYIHKDALSFDQGSAFKVPHVSTQFGIVTALKGITGIQQEPKDALTQENADVAEADVSKLQADLQDYRGRIEGVPSIAMNMWNQLKKGVYSDKRINTIMSGMLIPLVEQSLQFFRRTTGHPYVESLIENSKQKYCPNTPQEASVIVPPALRLHLVSAVQSTMAVETALNQLQYSGELTSFLELLDNFYYSIGYEVLTLASPAEVPLNPDYFLPDRQDVKVDRMAAETIIKPQLPFYYAPVCNVILPRMFTTVSVNQDESQIPTRITATQDTMPVGADSTGTNFRGPHSVREAIAYASTFIKSEGGGANPDLKNTLAGMYGAPGRYEQGRGMKHLKIGLPWWLRVMNKGEDAGASGTSHSAWPDKDTQQYDDLVALLAAWESRTGYDVYENDDQITEVRNEQKDMLNPYNPKSGLQPFQSLLFTSVDYEFTKALVSSRNGTVECVFNPYIIPGYPMDVIDDTPSHPSFHAMCSSVTHTITSRSIGTTVGMVAVMTYAELSNYYIPPAQPWLQTALKIINTQNVGDGTVNTSNTVSEATISRNLEKAEEYGNTDQVRVNNAGTLLFNSQAKDVADQFYASTLGIRAADPSIMIDWRTGQASALQRKDGGLEKGVATSVRTANGGDANDYNTTVGNLRLVARPIESRTSIQDKFEYKFIDLNPINYNNSTVQYQNPKLGLVKYLEPGASLFLDYQETREFINDVRGNAKQTGPEGSQ